MNNKPDFRTEFIRFFKSRGYPASGIFCNAKIGNTHVEYLITVPNSNEKLAIMTAQGIDDNPTQIRKPFEYCLQEMGNPDYSLCLLTPSDEVNSQYSFSLYHLDNNGIFKKINFEFLPIFKTFSSTSNVFKDVSLSPTAAYSEVNYNTDKQKVSEKKFDNFWIFFFVYAFSLLNMMEDLVSEDVIDLLGCLVLIMGIIFLIILWRRERKKNKSQIQSGKEGEFWCYRDDDYGDDGGGGGD